MWTIRWSLPPTCTVQPITHVLAASRAENHPSWCLCHKWAKQQATVLKKLWLPYVAKWKYSKIGAKRFPFHRVKEFPAITSTNYLKHYHIWKLTSLSSWKNQPISDQRTARAVGGSLYTWNMGDRGEETETKIGRPEKTSLTAQPEKLFRAQSGRSWTFRTKLKLRTFFQGPLW